MAVALPVRAVDAHAHCYDPARQANGPSSGFHVHQNEMGSAEDFRSVLDAHGMTHALLVNPLGGYGVDNSYMLQAISNSGGHFKGVALLNPAATDSEIETLVDGGVVGIRFNLNFPESPSLFGADGERALAIARAAGWFVQVHFSGETLLPALPILRTIDTLVFDHCGRPDIEAGADQPGFAQLLELGRQGRAYVKLSAFFRMASSSTYQACDPYVEALMDAFPSDRLLWGSDWPFIRSRRRVDYGPQLAYIREKIASEVDIRQVLWDNPARLCGFDS